MPRPDQSDFLFVRASEVGKVYEGGTFCADEHQMQALYEGRMDPVKLIQINQLRRLTADGLSLDESEQRLPDGLGPRATNTVMHCLGRIASGHCDVFRK